ncbi:hypothetical protein HanRHA438_Chr02g0063011 [Helianthus annuus]|nr:hypothetical protein HanIR_Chr02g0068981 [Helianthus annuus]KAJ0776973.1 hypothetical protein HanLR1_Chr02g0051891 [Helianthus annuus]KAJ0939601.1 hypothetical protein HanRHA438_Chr02g0063011 [Helianthus annuus]
MANWELRNCCNHDQLVFLITLAFCVIVILAFLGNACCAFTGFMKRLIDACLLDC